MKWLTIPREAVTIVDIPQEGTRMPSHPRSAWTRLGELLRRRRIELDPRYRNRRAFEAERARGLYRIINAIEVGERDNYEPGTIAALEAAYSLAPGSIAAALDGGELAPSSSPSLSPADLSGASREAMQRPAPPSRPPAPPRRDVEFRVTGCTAEDLQPYIDDIIRSASRILADLFGDQVPAPPDPGAEVAIAALPGRLLFPGDDEFARLEAEAWDKTALTLGEKVKIIAIGRFLAGLAAGEQGRRTGLGPGPAAGVTQTALRALEPDGGQTLRASS